MPSLKPMPSKSHNRNEAAEPSQREGRKEAEKQEGKRKNKHQSKNTRRRTPPQAAKEPASP